MVEELQRSLSVALNGVIIRTLVPYRFWEFLPIPGNLRYRRAIDRLRRTSGELRTLSPLAETAGLCGAVVAPARSDAIAAAAISGRARREIHNPHTETMAECWTAPRSG